MLNLCIRIRIIFCFAMVFFAASASASIGGRIIGIGGAFNPCNEILLPPFSKFIFNKHSETWNGVITGKRISPLCPPWNKTDRSGCLKQFALPQEYEMIYNRYCAEATGSNNFFDPQIKVRVQTCNLACWTMSDNLSGDGECTIYPGPFGIPTMRLCARIALPAEPATDTPADHGYTYAWHLGPEGVPQQDPIYTGDDGQPIYHARPKICAYWDPSIYDALANYASFLFGGALAMGATAMSSVNNAGLNTPEIVNEFIAATGVDPSSARRESADLVDMLQANLQPDLWDFNPVKQSIHFHEGGVFFIFELLIQLVKMGVGINDMLNSLLDSIPVLKYIIYVISLTYWIIQALAAIGEHVMIPVLEYLGQFNNVVSAALGCAMIPLGPYPPPYCDTLTLPPPLPTMTPICRTDANGVTETPNTINKCVRSPLQNNVIRNSVRVGFRDLMALCPPNTPASDTCVKVHPAVNANALHALTNNTGIVQVCDAAKSNVPCVESPTLLQRCGTDGTWCNQGIRIVYSLQARGAMPLMRDFFDATASPCTASSAACQGIWGVNIGNWRDLSLTFPAEESGYNSSDLTSTTQTLENPNGDDFDFKLLIPRVRRDFGSDELDPTRMYLMMDDLSRYIDSVRRQSAPKPTVYECGSQGVTCTSHHLRPGIVAMIQSGTDSTKGKLSAETHLPRPGGTIANNRLNLAGYEFTAFVTDDQFRQSPFDDANAVNPSTRLGDYAGVVSPSYDQNGDLTPPTAVYTGGLEYYQNKYVMGGEQICLSGYQFDDCLTSASNTNCVLASKTNSNLIRCTDFINIVSTRYGGIGLCTDDQATSYGTIETVSVPRPVSGNMSVTIKGDTQLGPYCYDYSGRNTTGALCETSMQTSGRIDPIPQIGDVLADNEFYNFDRTNPPSPDSLAVRNKTAVEHGVCVDVPDAPSCLPITESNATWGASPMGGQASGTCQAGYIPKGPGALDRRCTINRSTLQSVWEPLTANMGCRNGCSVTALNGRTNSALSFVPATKRLNLITGALPQGTYVYSFRFDVANLNDVNMFRYMSGGADDYIKVEVNGVNAVNNGYSSTGGDRRGYFATPSNVPLKRYLSVGTNTVTVTVRVVGGGGGDARFTLNIAGCSNVTISR